MGKSRKHVGIERWGKDHWSTLAYIETCCVDGKGYLDHRRLRLDGLQYPTMAKNENIVGHSDLDCIRDMVDEGLIEGGRATQRFSSKPGDFRATFQYSLTKRGEEVCAALRAHKQKGGYFATFTPPLAADGKVV